MEKFPREKKRRKSPVFTEIYGARMPRGAHEGASYATLGVEVSEEFQMWQGGQHADGKDLPRRLQEGAFKALYLWANGESSGTIRRETRLSMPTLRKLKSTWRQALIHVDKEEHRPPPPRSGRAAGSPTLARSARLRLLQ